MRNLKTLFEAVTIFLVVSVGTAGLYIAIGYTIFYLVKKYL